jgi:hypothetical protein
LTVKSVRYFYGGLHHTSLGVSYDRTTAVLAVYRLRCAAANVSKFHLRRGRCI